MQSYSDEELFWIIQNGIRYTGMPSFAKVETPMHIWDTVNYVPTLRGDLRVQGPLFAAELTLAQARGNEYQSLVQLYRSLGGGWQQ